MRQAKQRAAQDGTTLTALIEMSLRRTLQAPPPPRKRIRLPKSGSGGERPGVDITDNSALLDHLEKYDANPRR
jgi:hypothetical protein